MLIDGQPPIMRRNRGKPGQRPYPTEAQKSDYDRIRQAYNYPERHSLKEFSLTVVAHYRRDIDLGHVILAIEDALQGLLWENDRQIRCYEGCFKSKDSAYPHTRVVAVELENVYRS
jgi:hypothetical protein